MIASHGPRPVIERHGYSLNFRHQVQYFTNGELNATIEMVPSLSPLGEDGN